MISLGMATSLESNRAANDDVPLALKDLQGRCENFGSMLLAVLLSSPYWGGGFLLYGSLFLLQQIRSKVLFVLHQIFFFIFLD